MRIPDPIANTTTEAYLAYKAGVLSEGELKPKLYDPYIHLDAWLAYWAGLAKSYPVKNVGKNLFDKDNTTDGYRLGADGEPYADAPYTLSWYIPVKPNTTYTISFGSVLSTPSYTNIASYGSDKTFIYRWTPAQVGSYTLTTQADAHYLRVATPLNREDTTQCELGSTATTYEPYTGEPEMLTDEEALIAYLSGVTNTYPEEFRDPADVRVAAYLKYLVSARWGRPEYPVTNEELYLSMMDAPYIPAGEPSSDIEIDDTAEAPFKDVKMYGDTSQTTYTGKNLYNVQTKTSRGITTTVNADGSFSIKGTATADADAYLINETKPISLMENGETYTCWISDVASLPAGVEIRLGVDNEGSWVRNLMSAMSGSTLSRTFTANTTGGDAIRCEVYVARGTTVDVSNIKVQLEKGSTATSYEPYVGGVPAPNPDYPQAVNTVTGRQVVKVEGKNLFGSQIVQGYYAFANGGFSSGGTSYVTNKDKISVTAGATYTISANKGVYDGSNYNGAGVVFFNNGTFVSSILRPESGTFTVPSGANQVIYNFYKGSSDSSIEPNDIIWVQLEKGSTATDYLPYQSGEYEINLGKNLFDASNANQITGQIQSDKTLDTSAGSTVWVRCEPNTTYVLSKINTPRTRIGTAVAPLDSSHNLTNYVAGTSVTADGRYYGVITSGAQDTYLYITYSANTGVSPSTINIQLEKGSTPTSYSAYFTPIELCKIGTYQDYIYENDGKWYLHKEVGKLVQNGTETGWYNISGSTSYARTNAATSFVKNVPFFANRGLTTPTSGTRIKIPNNNLYWYETGYESIEAFKSSLATTNLIVYAPLLTPTDTAITNQALIDQLNALKNGGSYTGTTYIKVSATDPNLPGLLGVEAYKYD